MNASRYDWHSSILGAPSLVAAMLFGLSLDSELLGVVLALVAMILFSLPYRLYFSMDEGHSRRSHVVTNTLFIIVQIAFWGIAFALLHIFKNPPAI
jgi:drug/metabolite transporter (DMT)-like permease